MKLLVFGSRDYSDWFMLDVVLHGLHKRWTQAGGELELCQGEANGADIFAKHWAKRNAVRCSDFPADWDRLGDSAGHVRNLEMANVFQPTHGLGFISKDISESDGSRDMMEILESCGIEVRLVWSRPVCEPKGDWW